MARFTAATRRLAVPVVVLVVLLAAASSARAELIGKGNKKFAVVLCNFKDNPNAPRSMEYWNRLFTQAGVGRVGMFDYWSNLSFNQLSIAGTTVVGWNNARNPADVSKTITRGEWQALGRGEKLMACADGPSGFDFAPYFGIIVVFPEAKSLVKTAISATDTQVTLQGREHFPDGTAPFVMGIGTDGNEEKVKVTARTDDTFTIERGQPGGATARAHAAGARVLVYGDLFGGQFTNLTVRGKKIDAGVALLPHHIDMEGVAHETGHATGLNHSRGFRRSTSEYGDDYDILSAYVPDRMTFSADMTASNRQPDSGDDFGVVDEQPYFGRTVLGAQPGVKGPGLVAIQLDRQGWIPADRHLLFNNAAVNQTTATFRTLSDPNALAAPAGEKLEARIPAAVTIQNVSANDMAGNPLPPSTPPSCTAPNACTTSDYYTVEYRQRAAWDRGLTGVPVAGGTPVAGSGVLLHLKGKDERPYWMDQDPMGNRVANGGFLFAGDVYADPARKTFVAVNSLNGPTARVTIGSDKIAAKLTWSGATSGEFSDRARLAADLRVDPSGDPVPNALVELKAGGDTCSARTDAGGHAECTVPLGSKPGVTTATAHFDGNAAYKPADVAVPFTINKETTKLSYGGATSADYHDPFTASATLVDPDGGDPPSSAAVSFKLGASDSCTAQTDGSGSASCPITPNQVPGAYSMVSTFEGNDFYLASSDTTAFEITKQETFLTYDGPPKVANDFPATMSGTLTEEVAGGAPVGGRTVRFTLGSGAFAQICQGTTDATGRAECTIANVAQPASATTVPAAVAFAEDAFYLASNASATVKVLYYTGRAYGVSVDALGLLALPPQADTGSIQTSVRSQTTRSALLAFLPLVTANGMTGSVTTGGGTSTARGTATSVSIGLPGVPVIQATGVVATSTSTCLAATGTTRITSLRIGGVAVALGSGPKVISAGLATVRIDERMPVPGADKGLTVYALHVNSPGVADVVVGAARSDIHNC